MLHSRARRADDRTSGGGGGKRGMVVVTMRSRVRYGIAGDFGRLSRNEHKILRLFRRTPISRFLYLELSVPNIFPALSVLSLLSPALRPYLLTRASAPVVFFTLLFGVSTSFTSSPPPLAAPPASSLLSRPGSFQTLLHSCEIAFKLFGFLTRRGFIVRNPRCIAQRVPVDLREVGR